MREVFGPDKPATSASWALCGQIRS